MGMGQRGVNIQHPAHHHAHSSRHTVAVATKLSLICDPHGIEIGAHPRDQLQSDRGRDAALLHEAESIAHYGIGGYPRDDCSAGLFEMIPGVFRRRAFVGEIVKVAAESVEAGGSFRGDMSEEASRPMNAATLRGEGRVGGSERFGRIARRAHGVNAAGMRASTTFAEQSTPGSPAPGWVPAPVR